MCSNKDPGYSAQSSLKLEIAIIVILLSREHTPKVAGLALLLIVSVPGHYILFSFMGLFCLLTGIT